MTLHVFNALMFGVFGYMAMMVVVRFAFYRRKDHPMGAVYFWGGAMFFTLALANIVSNLLYGTDLHGGQVALTCCLSVWTLYQAVKKRRVVRVNV